MFALLFGLDDQMRVAAVPYTKSFHGVRVVWWRCQSMPSTWETSFASVRSISIGMVVARPLQSMQDFGIIAIDWMTLVQRI
jgi:hypothetical protein